MYHLMAPQESLPPNSPRRQLEPLHLWCDVCVWASGIDPIISYTRTVLCHILQLLDLFILYILHPFIYISTHYAGSRDGGDGGISI